MLCWRCSTAATISPRQLSVSQFKSKPIISVRQYIGWESSLVIRANSSIVAPDRLQQPIHLRLDAK